MDVATELLTIITEQIQKGLKKYGCTVDKNQLSPVEWIDHAVREQVDNCFYLLRLKRDLPIKSCQTCANYNQHKEFSPCLACENEKMWKARG